MSSTVTASARQYTAANSEYHSIADASQTGLDVNGHNPLYFFAWVKSPSIDAGVSNRSIAGKAGNGSSNRSWFLLYNNGDDAFKLLASSDGTNSTNLVDTNVPSPAQNTWYFVEGWHNPTSDLIGINVNRGTDITTAFSGGLYDATTQPFVIGNGGANPVWDGQIAVCAYFNAVPDASTRNAFYNSGDGILYKDLADAQKTNLVSWWDGAETSGVRVDAHGNGGSNYNHLSDNNTVTSAAGKVTYTAEDASQFTAANSEYLSHVDNADFDTGDIDFSFAGWLYFDSFGTFRIGFPSKWSTNNYEYTLEYDTPGDKFGWYVSANGTSIVGVTATTPVLTTSKWYFVACWHDSVNNVIRISVNDGTVYSTAHSTGVKISNNDFTPGKIGSYYMSGRMANWGYWKKVLSAAEITSLYNRGFGKDYSDLTAGEKTSMVGFWPLTESSGTRVDAHGSNDLTDNNTVTSAAGVVYDVPAVVSSSTKSLALLGVG